MDNRAIRFAQSPCLSLAAVVALALATVAGCASETDPSGASTAPAPATPHTLKSNPSGTGETASMRVDNTTGGSLSLSNGTTIEVPPGALPPGVDTITVTSAPAAAPSEYAAASPVYVFGPDGTVFLKPLKVSIPVSLPAGKSASDLTILWSRAHGDGFDMVPSELTAVAGSSTGFVATGEVTHFSQGFCGLKFATDPHPAKDAYGQ